MAYYRVYFLDNMDHITAAAECEVREDLQAIEFARAQLEGRPDAEVWQETRLVARLNRAEERI